MIGKLLLKDLKRKKIIYLSLILFIVLPALLLSNAAHMIMALSGSLNYLFEEARVPHFVQMHAGNPEKERIIQWAEQQPLVESYQIVEMITVDGSDVYQGNSGRSEAESVMDLSFVKQNRSFDFLLNMNNEPVSPLPGEIAVPLYFKEKNALKLGDPLSLKHGTVEMVFSIGEFLRDAQMNPSIIHSKRFVLNEEDFLRVKESFGESEYLIEFRLTDPGKLSDFVDSYNDMDLPAMGPAINYDLFQVVNVISDGIIISILLLVSLLFCLVTVLCLRFTILASIEDDYREIGVMKAIGIPGRYIKRIYFSKYVLLGGAGAGMGYAASFLLNRTFTANILLYMGQAPLTPADRLIPLGGALAVFLIVLLSCMITLRRFDRISAVEALRAGCDNPVGKQRKFLSLSPVRYLSTNLILGFRDLLLRFRLFWLLGFVFFLSSFIILVPLNFLNTIESPSFISYLGIGRCDIRIDLRQSDDIALRYDEMIRSLKEDPDIAAFVPMVTSLYKVPDQEGRFKSLTVESGDFTVFPLEYLEGAAPLSENDIALSLLNAGELELTVGDPLTLISGERERAMTVCGIYQDVTSGGYTAKVCFPPEGENLLWYVVNLDIRKDGPVSLEAKVQDYSRLFYPARVTHTEVYLSQTLGDTIQQLRMFTGLATGIALLVSLMITSLFLRMILAKDTAQISIMRGIGFSHEDIRSQYLVRILFLLVLGVCTGTLAANTAGESLVSAIWSLMGASQIRFVIDPLRAYLMYPLMLIGLVSFVTLKITSSVKHCSISELNAE